MTAPSERELLRGTLDTLVLKALSWAPMHGLAVLRWIESAAHERLEIDEGALYPCLHRMEQRGWLLAEWGYTDQGRESVACVRRSVCTVLPFSEAAGECNSSACAACVTPQIARQLSAR